MTKDVTKFSFQYDLNVYLNAIQHEGQVWFPAKEIYELLGRSGRNGSAYIKKFPDRSKRFIRVTRAARPDGVKTWHINREGVALAIERSKECAPEEAKRACSLENWLTCEVYPELPDDQPQEEKENEQDKEMKTSVPETKQESDITTIKSDDSVNRGPIFTTMIEINDNQELGVSGRMLHQFLEIQTEYKKWFERMSEYGFINKVDYARIPQKCPTLGGDQIITNHILTLDMAKELCMLQRTERGKKARQYFIQLEKDWNSPEKVMARALKLAEVELGNLRILAAEQEKAIAELQPKAKVYDAVMNRESTYTISDVAMLNNLPSSRLFRLLREKGWLYKPTAGKHLQGAEAPEGVFKNIQGIYGDQLRVTVAGKAAITKLIQTTKKF